MAVRPGKGVIKKSVLARKSVREGEAAAGVAEHALLCLAGYFSSFFIFLFLKGFMNHEKDFNYRGWQLYWRKF